MTKSINCNSLSGNLCSANCTVNYVIIRTVYSTCSRCVVFNNNCAIGMTKSVNCFLSNKNFATNRAVLTFCKTCFCTSSSLCLVSYLGMTESGNDCCGSANLCITYSTVNYRFIRALSFASRFNILFDNCIALNVTLCRNLVIYVSIAANRTLIGSITVGGTSRISNNSIILVTKRINCNSFSLKLYLTYSTVNYVVVRARIYAIGSLFIFLNSLAFGMTESINCAISISMITADTSMCCVTSISTCRIGYNRLVLVSESLTLSSVTSGACLRCRTSSINPIVLYAKAYVAFVATVVFICVMVTGSFNNFCSCCFTSFTSKCLNTCLFALRFCSDYTLIPSVTCSRNCFLSNENFVTNGAMLTFSKTCFCTSSSLCSINNLGMTKSRNCLLSNLIIAS